MHDATALTETDLAPPTPLAEVLPAGAMDAITAETPRPHWAARAALRFSVSYFGLYVLTTQMLPGSLPLPVGSVPNLGSIPPMTWMVEWVAAHIFGATLPLVLRSGSGDKTFDWVHSFIVLVVALAVTALWTWRARGTHDLRLHKWFRLFLRFVLGATLISYGAVKVIPLQMPFPSLNRLLERYGDFSPMGVLWYSIGASPAYEIFTGAVEMLAGILLCIPYTAPLGALLSLAAAFQVFVLNMTFDVPVKLFSFHLVLMSIFLLAPDLRRLLNVLVLNRIAGPSIIPPFGKTRRAMRIAAVAQIVFGAYLVGMNVYGGVQAWSTYGGGAPKSALYGIWDIEEMSINGQVRSPLLNDYERWRRVTFDRPTAMSFLRMDDTVLTYGTTIDESAKTIALAKAQDTGWKATLTYERPQQDQLTLKGAIDGRTLDLRLKRIDRSKFMLVNRGFNWVQEYPFNR